VKFGMQINHKRAFILHIKYYL